MSSKLQSDCLLPLSGMAPFSECLQSKGRMAIFTRG